MKQTETKFLAQAGNMDGNNASSIWMPA